MRKLFIQTIGAFRRNRSANVSTEFAAAVSLLLIGVLNTLDLGYYAYQRMEVQNAAEMGAQAAWTTCNDPNSMLPATQKCSNLNSSIDRSVQSTALGSSISVASGYPKEGYYCVNSSNSLQSVGSLSNKPADCSSVGDASSKPGDYVQVSVTYKFTPLFGLTAIGALGISSITATTWMRLG